jgi:hypothetical protein
MQLTVLGHSQNHLAVAGGYEVKAPKAIVGTLARAPTRYREVVLTVSKFIFVLFCGLR